MIKSWQKFNEAIQFQESDQFRSISQKYAIKKEDIKDFLDDLSDETDFQSKLIFNHIQNLTDKSFVVKTTIRLSKQYKNPKGLKDYQNYLETQSRDLDWVIKTCERISKAEETDLEYGIDKLPFIGSDNNIKEYDDLELIVILKKEIVSDELNKAYKQFLESDNPERDAYQKVIKKIIGLGIPEKHAKKLIDAQPDYEDLDFVIFGFMTDFEIFPVATFNKDTKRIFFEKTELNAALDYYENGDCKDRLGENYL